LSKLTCFSSRSAWDAKVLFMGWVPLLREIIR
jgi:hypothetical protein